MGSGTLYNKIITVLKDKIQSGEYPPGRRLPTEMELAAQFGVSRITSQRALAELEREGLIYRKKRSGSFVSPGPETNVNDRRYISTRFTASSTKMISMILPLNYTHGGLLETIRGAADHLKEKGYYLGVRSADADLMEEKGLLEDITDRKLEGMIYYPMSDKMNLEFLTALYMNSFPIVTIDKYFDGFPISYVVSDNYSGSYRLTEYLTELGHERIAFVSGIGIENATSVRDRYLGYCKCLKDKDIVLDSRIVVLSMNEKAKGHGIGRNIHPKAEHGNSDQDCSRQQYIRCMLDKLRGLGVTAIQCINDSDAISVLKTCSDTGIKVPDDLSVTGFDNIATLSHLDVPLTTVEQDFHTMGAESARILVDIIENGIGEPHKVVLPVKLIERQSCRDMRPHHK